MPCLPVEPRERETLRERNTEEMDRKRKRSLRAQIETKNNQTDVFRKDGEKECQGLATK